MAENKTKPTDADVTAFLDSIESEQRRAEGHALRQLMERVVHAHGAAGQRGFELIGYCNCPEVYVGCGFAAWNLGVR